MHAQEPALISIQWSVSFSNTQAKNQEEVPGRQQKHKGPKVRECQALPRNTKISRAMTNSKAGSAGKLVGDTSAGPMSPGVPMSLESSKQAIKRLHCFPTENRAQARWRGSAQDELEA